MEHNQVRQFWPHHHALIYAWSRFFFPIEKKPDWKLINQQGNSTKRKALVTILLRIFYDQEPGKKQIGLSRVCLR